MPPLPDASKVAKGDRSAPLYDLHVNETQLEAHTQRERVSTAIALGYDGVALVHQARPALTDKDKCTILPMALEALRAARRVTPQAPQGRHGNACTFRQLTRLNIPIDDANTAQAACSNTAVLHTYDIVAVQPLQERAFAQACTSLDVDIISLDLSKRLPYRFKPALLKAAVERGVVFEITFSAILRDPSSRKQLFANAQALCNETRGRGIIISSAAKSAMELRGPQDVVNLAIFLGLTQEQARRALTNNVAAALQHARTRKAFRGVLTLQIQSESQDGASGGQQQLGTGAAPAGGVLPQKRAISDL